MPEHIHEHFDISLFFVERATYTSLQLIDKSYPHWILSYVARGQLLTGSGGEQWSVQAGDVMLHPPHVPFSEIATGTGEHLWIQFTATLTHNIDLFQFHAVPPVLSIMAKEQYTSTFQLLLHTWHHTVSPFRSMLVASLTLQLCNLVLESWRQQDYPPRPAVLSSSHDRFIEIVKYMSAHVDQKMTRDELAAMAHLHPGYFDRVFRRIYGMAPMQMLRNIRLDHAARLLATTDAPLSSVAYQCGLGDAAYLHRVFRQHYGQTPGHYRQSAKSAMKSYIRPLLSE